MRRVVRPVAVLGAAAVLLAAVPLPSSAAARPVVTGLSAHAGTYWGGMRITVRGRNLTHVVRVTFGAAKGHTVHVVSSGRLTVRVPEHRYGRFHVRVTTSTGTSSASRADTFTFTRPTMDTPIQGGLTGHQEQRISARVRAAHHNAPTARASAQWTAAMGLTAVARARSWLGLPYSWAGGNSRGPTRGVCAHNGGDLDCHVVGFDCSGLALYSWAPYKALVHHAATQYRRAGKFHPTVGQLVPGDLVFFSGYVAHGVGHVAVYEGRGMVVQAEQSGTPVMRSRLVDVIAHSGVYRGATRPLTTGAVGPAPQVSAVTAQVPATGGLVTITGTGLGGVISVTAGSTTIYTFVARSASRIVVRVPAHRAGPVTLAVSTAWRSAIRTLTYVAAPVASGLNPGVGPVDGGNTVTVTGTNLAAAQQVEVGGASVAVLTATARTLTFVMPAHAAGTVLVRVRSPFGVSAPKQYTFVLPPPSSPPPSGPGPGAATPDPAPTGAAPASGSDPVSPPPATGPPTPTPDPTTSPTPTPTSTPTPTTWPAPTGPATPAPPSGT